jgi:hypothetical protein
MAFGSLLTTNSTPTVLNPFLAARPSSTATSAAAAPAAQSAPSPAQSAAAPSGTPAPPASGGGAHGGGGGGGGAAASNAASLLDTATVYTTTVAGKQYSGSVVESGGEYTASVPNLQGATASGAIEQAAENNLDTRIDELV